MQAFDKAYKMKRQMQDERDWMMGQYVMSAFGTVLSCALSKNSNAKYIEKPFLSQISATDKDPEANERLAVVEMQKAINVWRTQGLPETDIRDI